MNAVSREEIESRAGRARELFRQGFNCSQSVVGAYADLYDIAPETALRMAASFGAGMGRLREVCGAASGMFLLAGLECGSADPSDRAAKALNYKAVQELAAVFKERNHSLICAELLGLRDKAHTSAPEKAVSDREKVVTTSGKTLSGSYVPQERTPEYYRKRPCEKMVEEGARIFGEFLLRRSLP